MPTYRWWVECDFNKDHDHADEDVVRPVQCPECGGTVYVTAYRGQKVKR